MLINTRTDKQIVEYSSDGVLRMNKLGHAVTQMDTKESIVYVSISIKYSNRQN